MKISILTIGNELLKGTTVNFDTAIVGKELFNLGVPPVFQAAVNDTEDEIRKILDYIVPFSDVIITTGGLGPTTDDLTVTTVADYFGLKLYKNQDVIDNIRERMQYRTADKKRKIEISEENLKQAFVPENSEIIKNANGTAPGIFINKDGKLIFLLPGPPSEMKPMLFQKVIPEISKMITDRLYYEVVQTIGVPESDLQGIVGNVIGTVPGIDIAYRAQPGACELTIYGYCRELVKEHTVKIRNYLGGSALAERFSDIVEELFFYLNNNNLTLATAESCTGGMIASRITELPGVSSVFRGGCVVYSNELKEKLLGVRTETLKKFGAVSSECALEMAAGLREKLNVDAGIAVTGIAGPDGGTLEKPVGLVYIAVRLKDKIKVKKYIFNGSRDSIRNRTVPYALDMLRQLCRETNVKQ